MKALSIYRSTSGCDFHRVKMPFDYEPGVIDNSAYEGLSNTNMIQHISVSELITWNRICAMKLDKIQDMRDICGFKIVVDMDDHWNLYYGHILYNAYKKHRHDESLLANIKISDAVTVTTNRLRDQIIPIKNNVFVIPNCIPHDGQFLRKEWPDKTTFTYVAGSSHGRDILLLKNPMKRIASERWFTDNADFALCGFSPGPVWNGMERVFSAGGKLKSYIRRPGLPLSRYMDHYENATCALVPLEENQFNSYKSNLKILEAGMKKMPVICSFVPPYSDGPEAPVLWVKKQSDWYNHMKWVARNPKEAMAMGEELYKWVNEKYNFNRWNKIRFDYYQEIINS